MDLTENSGLLEEYRRRAREIVSQMTLEEKIFQTLYQAPAIERLGVKAYNWWNEALHGVARAGVATVFPQSIGLAATFDEDLIEEIAGAISTEARGKFNLQQAKGDTDIYKGLTFWSPNVNIFRDPRWGRGHETFGEDPYLTSRMGVRFVKGIQGHDERYLKAAACAKHLAVHSGPEGVRHGFDAVVSRQDLYETYLPAFKACIREGHVEAVMGAYNRVNGVPCCANHELIEEIIRDEFGFEGHFVSDCGAIQDICDGHHVAATYQDAAAMAMENGCDLNCGKMFYFLKQAVEEGKVSEKRIDEAVERLFTTRLKLGVLDRREDNPFDRIPYTVVDSEPMRRLNEEAASRCLVLLKNEGGLLPLDLSAIKTIGVIGPNADSRRALVGNYEGTASHYWTVLEGIQDYVGDRARVMYSEGCHLYKDRTSGLAQANDRMSEVKGVCDCSDVVVVCLGLDASIEGEEGDASNEYGSGDKPDLNLPGLQEQVLKTACESGKPVILVLLSGSALAVDWAQENVPAILQGWYPGACGGRAIAKLLFGETCPEGKLPVTFYHRDDVLPDFEDYSMKGRTYRYLDHEALYPFGYGLSYTCFSYEEVTAEAAVAAGGPEAADSARPADSGSVETEEAESVKTTAGSASTADEAPVETETAESTKATAGGPAVTVRAKVKNTGSVAGAETVQVYVKIPGADTPNAQLKGIRKVRLAPGEEQTVEIALPKEAFGLYDAEGHFRIHTGEALVYVGGQGPDARSETLTGQKVHCLPVVIAD